MASKIAKDGESETTVQVKRPVVQSLWKFKDEMVEFDVQIGRIAGQRPSFVCRIATPEQAAYPQSTAG